MTSRKVDNQAEAAEEGQRIRLIRERHKMTAEEFADRIEVSRGYLSELENGKRRASRKLMQRVLRLEEQDVTALSVLLTPSGKQVDSGVGVAVSTERVEHSSKSVDADVFPNKLASPDLALTGKQVSKYVAADAFEGVDAQEPLSGGAGYRSPAECPTDRTATSRRRIDMETMEAVIRIVSTKLDERRLKLPADKFAQLIVLIYERLAESEPGQEQVARTTERYLRLVA